MGMGVALCLCNTKAKLAIKGDVMNYQKLMTDSLTSLLNGRETLKCSFFAILLQGTNFYSGYWGLSENNLLGAVLTFSGREVSYTIKVPLEIKKVKIRKSFFPKQYIVKISFLEGAPCKLRVPLKAYQIEKQKENFEFFCKELANKSI